MNDSIQERLTKIRQSINNACIEAGRDIHAAQLIVVTKGQDPKKINEVLQAGAHHLGENYPEETAQKMEEIIQPDQLIWHMIGHLQSRKIKKLQPHFKWIHSIDSFDLTQKIDRFYASTGQTINILLEINLAAEETKSGFRMDTSEGREEFSRTLDGLINLKNVKLRGLMTMPPLSLSPSKSADIFLTLKELGRSLQHQYGFSDADQLSMGTSHDYEIAIRCGATMVRIGEAIMGKRNYN